MPAEKDRVAWADWVKGIGILSVVLGHVSQYFPGGDKYLNHVIYSYNIPLFILWAGVSASMWPDKYSISRKAFYIKRLKRYLIPYVLFSIINSAIKIGVLFISNKLTPEIIKDEALAFFITGNGTVWFLVTLFAVETIYYETQKCRGVWIIIVTAGCLLPFLFQGTATPFMILLMRTIFGFFYFMVGYLFWNRYQKYEDQSENRKSLMTGLSFIAAGCIMAFFCQYRIEFFSGRFSNGTAAIPISLLFSVGIILFCYARKEADSSILKMLQYFGKESMLIMLVHPTILLLFTYPFGNWFVSLQGITAFLASMVLFAIIVLLNIPVIYVINRWLPILKGEF